MSFICYRQIGSLILLSNSIEGAVNVTNSNIFDKSIYNPKEVKRICSDIESLADNSIEDLKVMTRTLNNEIQRVSNSKVFFISIFSIIMALIILVIQRIIDNFVANNLFSNTVLLMIPFLLYILMLIFYFFAAEREIKKLYDGLNNIRYVSDKKEEKLHEPIQQAKNKMQEYSSEIVTFTELMRRVDLTRRARIKASGRLRDKHEFYEKATHLYSLLVLILSIWFIDSTDSTTKTLLIASLSLTFFTMFLGVKNYKERASNFESNYQQLNVLLNKMQRLETTPSKIDQSKLKELHRDYEKLIIEKENHIDIDYMLCKPEFEVKYKDKITKYRQIDLLKKVMVYIPLIIGSIYFLIKVSH